MHLPSGALIGMSVAVMVAAAVGLAGIERRRGYRPRPGPAATLRPGPPLPAVIAALRRAARPAPPATADDDPSPGASPPPVTDPYLDPYSDDTSGLGQPGAAVPDSRTALQPGTPGLAPAPAPAGTSTPTAASPARSRSASAGPARPPSTSPPSAGSD